MLNQPVIESLEQQVGCYRRLAKLAEQQHDCVQQGNTEALLEVLTRRQEVLDQVADLEQVISPVKRQWGDFIQTLQADQQTRAESLLLQARELLELITQADQRDVLALQQQKLNLGRQISQHGSARQVNRNYGTAAYGSPASRLNVQT